MKKILLICYYFPPLGGAGITRPLNFFAKLPLFDIQCDVLTVKSVAYRRYEPALLPQKGVGNIYRAGSFDPQRIMYLCGMRKVRGKNIDRTKAISDLFFPDPKIGWYRKAVSLGRTLIENKRYDVIVSSSPPMTAHKVGMRLARDFDLPWIADFRDYWTSYKAENWFSSPSKIKKAHRLLNEINANATEIITANSSIADYLGRGITVYSGYDKKRAESWGKPEDDNQFIIGVLGTIDSLTPIKPLGDVLKILEKTNPDLYEKIKIVHVGKITDEQKYSLISDFPVGQTEFMGNLDRIETIKKLSESHMLYLGLSKEAEGIIPGRLFDMIASGRPIVVLSDEHKELEDMLSLSSDSGIFGENDISDVIVWIGRTMRNWMEGELSIQPLPAYAQKYSSDETVKRLSEIINQVDKVK